MIIWRLSTSRIAAVISYSGITRSLYSLNQSARFVKQVVTGHDPLIFIAFRQQAPQCHGSLRVPSIREQLRQIPLGIVDIGAGLSAWRAMQIQNNIQRIRPAPIDHLINEPQMTFMIYKRRVALPP